MVNFIKRRMKTMLALAGIFGILFQFAMPISAKATQNLTPVFKAEKELLRGVNLMTNQQDWSNPVSGKPGDDFSGLVWIHNNIVDSVAKNTVVKVKIPNETTNKTATLTATVSADNAAPLSGNMNLNLTEDSKVEFVPGSVRLFELQGDKVVRIPFPNGASGDSIIGSGVNIGDIQGCFNFIHYVSFGFKTIKKEIPKNQNFEILKTVRNVTTGETNFVKSNTAYPEDTLEYNVDIQNTGDVSSDIFVVDEIPAQTTFINDSIVITRDGKTEKCSDEFVGKGVSISNVKPNEKVNIKFKVKVNKDAKDCDELINKVTLHFDKTSICDTAKTIVKVKAAPKPSPTPTPVAPVKTPPVPAPTPAPEKPSPLPVSGPVETASLALSSLLTGAFGYIRYRKYMALKETKIISDLLSK